MDTHDDASLSPHAEVLQWAQKVAYSITRDPDLADDLVQETMETRLRSPEAAGHPNPRGWLARVLRNRASQHYRSQKRRQAREAATRDAKEAPAPPEELSRREAVRLVQEAVDKLDEENQELVRLRYFEDLSVAEIASRLDLTEGAVEYRLRKSRDSLRKMIRTDLGGGSGVLSTFLLPALGILSPQAAPAPVGGGKGRSSLGWVLPAVGCLLLGAILLPFLLPEERDQQVSTEQASSLQVAAVEESPIPAPIGPSRLDTSVTQTLEASIAQVRLSCRSIVDGDAVPEVALEVLHLARPTPGDLSTDGNPHYLFESGQPVWQVLQEDKVVADETGLAEVLPIEGAQAIQVLPGSGNGAWVLGGRQGSVQTPNLSHAAGGWPDLELELHPRTVTASGMVTDLDGNPVPHATVQGWIGVPHFRRIRPDFQVEVASDGSFEFPSVAAVGLTLVLQAEATGYLALRQYRHRLESGDPLPDIGLQLVPGSPILVQLSDSASRPVVGAKVTAMQPSVNQGDWSRWFGATATPVLTDSSGQATLYLREDKPATLYANHGQYQRLREKLFFEKAKEGVAQFTMTRHTYLRGEVVDGSGRPIPGATVSLHPRAGSWTASTDMDGHFKLIALPERKVLARKEGLGMSWNEPPDPSREQAMTITLRSGLDLSGSIDTPLESLEPERLRIFPLEQVRTDIHLGNSWIPRTAVHVDADGRFQVEGLPEGAYLLTYQNHSGLPWSAKAWAGEEGVVLSPSTGNGLFGALEFAPEFAPEIPQGTKARFRILRATPEEDSPYGVLIPNIRRSEEGVYRTGWLEQGEYILCSSHPGKRHFHQHLPVQVRADAIEKFPVLLRKNRSIQVEMVDEQGNPVVGFWVEAVNSHGVVAPVTMGAGIPREGLRGFRFMKPRDRQTFPLIEDDPDMRFLVRRSEDDTLLFSLGMDAVKPRGNQEILTVVIPADYR